tara:strand:+ start:11300 stop:11488 length:189 start_codon:yes stop_codon:yes gene_type:complete
MLLKVFSYDPITVEILTILDIILKIPGCILYVKEVIILDPYLMNITYNAPINLILNYILLLL